MLWSHSVSYPGTVEVQDLFETLQDTGATYAEALEL